MLFRSVRVFAGLPIEHCLADDVPGGSEMSWIQDPMQLAADRHQIFAAADIPYYVTGGVPAIVYSESRRR